MNCENYIVKWQKKIGNTFWPTRIAKIKINWKFKDFYSPWKYRKRNPFSITVSYSEPNIYFWFEMIRSDLYQLQYLMNLNFSSDFLYIDGILIQICSTIFTFRLWSSVSVNVVQFISIWLCGTEKRNWDAGWLKTTRYIRVIEYVIHNWDIIIGLTLITNSSITAMPRRNTVQINWQAF